MKIIRRKRAWQLDILSDKTVSQLARMDTLIDKAPSFLRDFMFQLTDTG
jgi:hypothetical protein